MKEYSKAPHVVVKAWGEQSLGELRVIEDSQAMVPDLQMAADFVLGMEWAL